MLRVEVGVRAENTPPRLAAIENGDNHGEYDGDDRGGDGRGGRRMPPMAQGLGAAEESPPKPRRDTRD